MSTLKRHQVLEEWRRCGGSIELTSVERDAFRQEQLLEALCIEPRLHPQVGGVR
jgi:hypothetical protein